jgi:hypothetical protein
MAYTQAELSGPVQFGDDKKKFFYDAQDAGDSFATVIASGYFNNDDDAIRMAVEDTIEVKTSAGVFLLQVTASTGGAVTTTYVGGDVPVETATTAADLSPFGLSLLSGTATGNEKIYVLPAPTRAGQKKSLIAMTATDHSVTTTGGYFFGSTGEQSITMIGAVGALGKGSAELLAVTTTQMIVINQSSPSTGEVTST